MPTLLVFSQNTRVYIDSISQEKTIYYDTEESDLGGRYEDYYANGIIKEKGQTLNEFGCWMKSGKFEFFDKKGTLTKIEFYHNWLENSKDGCHSTIHDIKVNEFHENGKLKAEKMYQSSYESLDTIKVGVWRFYNIYGYSKKTEVYPWAYPHKESSSAIKNAEKELIILSEKIRSFDSEINRYAIGVEFEKKLLTTLNLQNSWRYPFTELSKQITILSSKDSLIRTFAWDEMGGGSYHEMKSYIQYKNKDTLKIKDLRALEKVNGFRNAAIDQIVAFDNGYFVVGWGTFGGGAMHLIIAYYKFDNGILKSYPIFEDNKSEYGIEISRGDKFNLKINPELKQITFNETLSNEETGFYYQTGKLTTLRYIDSLKIFVKKESK